MRILHTLIVVALAACGSKQPASPDAAAPATSTPATTAAPPTEPATTPAADAAEPAPDAAPAPAPDAEPTPMAAPKFFLGKMALPQGIPIKMLVTVTGDAATLDVPLQGMKGVPLADVQVSDTTIAFTFLPPGAPPAAANKFKADKKEDGSFEGNVMVGETAVPIRFTSVTGPEALVSVRPQTPKPPFPYKTENVIVETPRGNLGCTLAYPDNGGPFGAVLMLTGSGVQDRDETIFDHKPFLVISDALARGGVASVRCDDRGAGESKGEPMEVDASVFIADAESVLAFMRKRPEINPDRVGLFGHSEGGMTAAAVASNPDNHIAFVVTMSGPAQTGRQVLVRQNRDLIIAQGAKAEATEAIEKAVDGYFAAIVNAPSPEDSSIEAAAKALAEIVNASVGAAATPEQSVSALTSNFTGLAKQKWLRGFLAADPANDLAKANMPTLALFGEKDSQVRAPENKAALEAAFANVKDPRLTINVVAGANHLFQDATTGEIGEYESIEQTINPNTLALMVDWMAVQAGAKK